MKLPKMYSQVNLKFWSLRNGLGSNYGVIFDIDTQVTRKCMRVMCDEGWKWQIINYTKILEAGWDYLIETDKECLDNSGMDFSDFEITTNRG